MSSAVVSLVVCIALVHGGAPCTASTPCIARREFLNELRELLKTEEEPTHSGGGVFTRWGRRNCPRGSSLVYKGHTGGSSWKTKGGSAEILCLPDQPIYGNYTPGNQTLSSRIYGAEYESENDSPNFSPLNDHEMPCAVCRLTEQRTAIMVPARKECLPGWRLEYWGYLMGGLDTHGPADYICVDENPEAGVGRKPGLPAQAMYLVQSICGTLPCPPYINHLELTCAVCSKK